MKKDEIITVGDLKEIRTCTGKKVKSVDSKKDRISIYSNKTVYHIEVRNIKDDADFVRLSVPKTKVRSIEDLVDFLKRSFA